MTEINGDKLTHEQTSYLEGLFAGLRNRGLTFQDVNPESGKSARLQGPSLLPEDLIPEERLKRELHPLDSYGLLLQHAASNQAPDKESAFRFKWQGLFYLSPVHESYMARLRIPGGHLTSHQMRELAEISDKLTTGYVQITTRSNLQIRLIEPKNTPEVLRRIQAVGLHTRGAGADNVRNLTCDPTSGIDPEERIATLPLVQELGQLILNQREFSDLPRKFNIAIYGGGQISTVEDTNDIGWRAVRVEPKADAPGLRSGDLVTEKIPAGVYFRCAVGGATGHQSFAKDLGVLVPPQEVVKVTAALLRVYSANGNRTNRKKARLKHLLESWSLDQYREATEKLLGQELTRIPLETAPVSSRITPLPHSHIGVFAQKQAGLFWIGASVPVGNISTKQMRRLAEIADLYGSGELRLTVWQNVVIPNIREGYLESAKKALVKAGLDWRQSNLKSGFIACTGNRYCKYASADTKGHALELMKWLDSRIQLNEPINVHFTGCPNSCAQHYMGDIGLLGVKVKVEGESREGYNVLVGGGFGDHQAVGRQLFQGVTMNALKPLLERILKTFIERRLGAETFQHFTTRHDVGTLQVMFSES